MADALLCIEIAIPSAAPALEEAIESELWELGAMGVERQDDTTFSLLVEDPRPRPPGSIRWRVFMEAPEDPDAAVEPYEERLGEVASVESWVLDDLSFLTSWKDHFRPTQVSPRIIVHPPWDRPTLAPGVVGVEIEPGMAFGTGTHQTTRLCLAALDRLLDHPGVSVLDVGCGSGVLSIAASRLGAVPVVAVDNDPEAVRIANENFSVNGVDVVADAGELTPDRGVFDVVVANILPHVLLDLRDALAARVADGGVLVLSGIIDGKLEEVVAGFAQAGMAEIRRDSDGEWWCVEGSFG